MLDLANVKSSLIPIVKTLFNRGVFLVSFPVRYNLLFNTPLALSLDSTALFV